jgi:hypothetical protein
VKRFFILIALAGCLTITGNAQIGWTLEQCRKQWGMETSIEHPYLDESQTTTGTTYVFDSGSTIEKWVALDPQGKVNDLYYIGPSKGPGFLKIAQLLAKERGVNWTSDPDPDNDEEQHVLDPAGPTPGELGYRHAYWIGYRNGIAVFHARYYFGKRDVNAQTWGESLHVLPIESPF